MCLVLKVFCDETASALRIRFGTEVEGTYLFIEFILKWWLIENNKKFGLDQRLKDVRRGAIESKNDWQISFLENEAPYFANSLVPNKRKKRYRKLTVETAAALCHTSQGLAHLTKNLLKQGHHQYICLGRFQSDPLEKQFGKYRQHAGGVFSISVRYVYILNSTTISSLYMMHYHILLLETLPNNFALIEQRSISNSRVHLIFRHVHFTNVKIAIKRLTLIWTKLLTPYRI